MKDSTSKKPAPSAGSNPPPEENGQTTPAAESGGGPDAAAAQCQSAAQSAGRSAGPSAGAAPDSAPAETVALPVAEHQSLVARAQERDLYRQELLRTKADFENYVKRMGRERLQGQEMTLRGFIKELLPVLDNFDRALGGTDATVDGIRRGILIVRQMLMKAIEENGIERIDALGKPFDPMIHEAIAHEETTKFPPDTVSEVMQPGYVHRGALVRAAQVKVARAPSNQNPVSQTTAGQTTAGQAPKQAGAH